MSKWTIASYNRAIGAAMARFSLSRKEAAQWYRELRDLKGSPVFRTDLKHHPRWSKQAAQRAQEKRLVLPARRIPSRAEIEEDRFGDVVYG
jgi:hypothetical protein